MSTNLHMIQLKLDHRAAMAFAHERNLLSGDGDLGYLLHAVLREAFQEAAPHPFAVSKENGGRIEVLGYDEQSSEELQERFRRFGRPELARVLNLETLCSKAMPTAWPVGCRLAFELRACPVVRQAREASRERSRETDAFLAEARRVGPDAIVRREEVYAKWLRDQLEREGAVRELTVRLVAFRRRRLARRDAARDLRASEKPDAAFRGEFAVANPQAFGALLRRGVGRHRAFGFGMLLLRPPRSNAAVTR